MALDGKFSHQNLDIDPGTMRKDAALISVDHSYVGRWEAGTAPHWYRLIIEPVDYLTLFVETDFGPHTEVRFLWATDGGRVTEVKPVDIYELEDRKVSAVVMKVWYPAQIYHPNFKRMITIFIGIEGVDNLHYRFKVEAPK